MTGAGSQFDVRSFHDAVLSCGMVPLSTLELTVHRLSASILQSHVSTSAWLDAHQQ